MFCSCCCNAQVGLLRVNRPQTRRSEMDSSGAAVIRPPGICWGGFSSMCVLRAMKSSGKRRNTESVWVSYLSDVLHVRPGVLLQQKELVPHPTSFGAPERNAIGVLSRQPRGPPPPPCSPSQGLETGPWRAEGGHGPQHRQDANCPSIHGDTTATFGLLPPSALCPVVFGQSIRSVLMLQATEAGKTPQTHIGRQAAPETFTEKNRMSIQGGEAAICYCTSSCFVSYPVVIRLPCLSKDAVLLKLSEASARAQENDRLFEMALQIRASTSLFIY